MIEVVLWVLTSEDGSDQFELCTVSLSGVPRVGDMVFAEGAEFEVRQVTWSEDATDIVLYSVKYGYNFPPESHR